jgi:hypothetical protein
MATWKLGRIFAPISALPTLFRAAFLSDDDLKARESESTLFRFFRSHHISDLRTVVAWATLLLFLFVIMLPFVLKWEAGSPSPPVEQFAGFKLVVTYLSTALTIYGAVLAWAYLSASSRLGVVDLFACEIITLCRVGLTFDIGKHYVEQYTKPGTTTPFVSKEDYFPVFDNNSRDLQLLESSVVNNITAFYTYMKATRDSLRKLSLIKLPKSAKTSLATPGENPELEVWQATMFSVIYVLFLSFESGRNAIGELLEYEPRAAENKMVMLITELTLYSFLLEYFERRARPEQDQLWRSRLEVRRLNYEKEVLELCCKVLDNRTNPDWVTSLLTVPELKKRYKETFNQLPPVPSGFPTDKQIEQAADQAAKVGLSLPKDT